MTDPFDNTSSKYKALDDAWKKFVSWNVLHSAEQDKWENKKKKIEGSAVDINALHQFIKFEFNDEERKKIYAKAERFLELSDKDKGVRSRKEQKGEKERMKEAAKSFTRDYIDFAEDFFKIQPFYYDDVSVWWLWDSDKSFWSIIDETTLLNEIYDSCKVNGIKITTSSTKSEITTAMKMVGRRHKPKDAHKRWIQFKDKAFSIRSGMQHQVTHDFFFTNPIPWEISESNETPTMDKLFKEWVGEKYVKTLYEILAYCCYSDYPIQVLFCLYGGGRNGKTCFLKVLSNFLGTPNVCSTDLDLLVGHNKSRFEIFKLYKKLACLLGETNFGVLDNSSILKKLTGGDLIGFEMKGKNPFDEYNYAKILIASNSLPASEDTAEGFYRRWVIIDFPNQFKEGKDITETIPKKEYNALARKVIGILPKLLEDGEFTNQGTIADRKHKYIMASNPLPHFINEYCYLDPSSYILDGIFFGVYCKYLDFLKKRVISKWEFTKNLNRQGLQKRRTSKDGEIGDYIEGIRWKDEYQDFGVFGVFGHIHTRLLHGELDTKSLKSAKSAKKEAEAEADDILTQYTVFEEETIQDTVIGEK